jgi:anti-sigma-K factor RskA
MTDQTDIPDDDRDGRAAEYVLGTLSLDERLAFETALAQDAGLRQAVAQWSARLQPLADSVTPVAPPAALRQRVLTSIAPAGQRPFSIIRWFALTIGAAVVAGAVAVAAVFVFTPRPVEIGAYAMLHRTDSAATDVIAFQIDKKNANMVLLANAPVPEAGKDYELWVLPPKQAPISLGVVKVGERQERPLPPNVAQYMIDFANLAVTVEPTGGSPSGAPTGPIVFVGNVRLMDNLTVKPPV